MSNSRGATTRSRPGAFRARAFIVILSAVVACDERPTALLSPSDETPAAQQGGVVSGSFGRAVPGRPAPVVDFDASVNGGLVGTPYFTYERPLFESRGTFYFEQLSADVPVATPTALAVDFSGWLAVVDADDVQGGGNAGDGNFANEPSSKTVIFWASTQTPNYWTRTSREIRFQWPVREIGLHYSVCLAICQTFGRSGVPASQPFVFEALDASGNVLETVSVGQNVDRFAGGDPTGKFNVFTPLTLSRTENEIYSLRVTGYDNLLAVDNFIFVRKNTEPVVNGGAATVGVEGAPIPFNGSLSFDREDPIDSLTFQWSFENDGSPVSASGRTASYTWSDDGTFDVTLEVTDPNGASASHTVAVTIHNAAPSPTITGAAFVAGGTAFAPVIAFTDPGAADAPWTYRVEWGDGTVETGTRNDAGAIPLSPHVYGAPGDYTFTLAVTDNSGAEGIAQHLVSVGNRAPVAALAVPATVNEGAPASFSAAGSFDPDGSAVEFSWDFGDGSTLPFDAAETVQHAYVDGDADGSPYTVTLRVRDASGDITATSASIVVHNVAPVLLPIAGGTAVQGEPFALDTDIVFDDAGAIDGPWTVDIDWGDGASESIARSATGPFAAPTHVYAATGTYAITITVRDRDGAASAAVSANAVIAAANSPPVIHSLDGPASVDEGGSASYTVSASDPDGDPLTIAWSVDGVPAGSGASFTHAFGDGPGSAVVQVEVTDGTFSDAVSTTVTLTNLPPVVAPFAGSTMYAGEPFTIATSFNDAFAGDGPWQVTVDWGDGDTEVFVANSVGSLPVVSHVYAAGTFTASVAVRDKDGGVGTASAPVSVAAPLEATIRITPRNIELTPLRRAAERDVPDDKAGVLQAHVSSSSTLDARQIDWSTVTLGDGVGDDTPVAVKKNGALQVSTGANAVAHFYRLPMYRDGDLPEGSEVVLVLRGRLLDGTPFTGHDTVRIR